MDRYITVQLDDSLTASGDAQVLIVDTQSSPKVVVAIATSTSAGTIVAALNGA